MILIEAKPAVIARCAVAYLHSSSDHFAVSACRTGNRSEVHHGGIAPIRDRGIELGGPIRRCVITDLQRKGVSGACPVVPAP